jgi:hypothetical protein
VVALLLAGLLLGGCGGAATDDREGPVSLRVTRDFGHAELGSVRTAKLADGDTVLRLLRSQFEVETGPRSIEAIDGLAATETRRWSFYVNGVEPEDGPADHELLPGDRVQLDYRPEQPDVRAIVGAYPEPFGSGAGEKRRPVRVECDAAESDPCRGAKQALEDAGIPVSSSSLGAPGTEAVTRLVVAAWPRARIVRGAPTLEHGPQQSGVFARFAADGATLELLDADGRVARTVRAGDGTALVAALQPRADELLWLVTALDREGLAAGVRALRTTALRDAYAVAVTGAKVEKLPLAAPK